LLIYTFRLKASLATVTRRFIEQINPLSVRSSAIIVSVCLSVCLSVRSRTPTFCKEL